MLVLNHSKSELYSICFFFFFFFWDSLLCEECSNKFSELLSTRSTSWGTGSASCSGFVGVV